MEPVRIAESPGGYHLANRGASQEEETKARHKEVMLKMVAYLREHDDLYVPTIDIAAAIGETPMMPRYVARKYPRTFGIDEQHVRVLQKDGRKKNASTMTLVCLNPSLKH